jgi:type IV pilus assembly protein PilV
MEKRITFPDKQAGAMLLEALISILIFSIGILAIVGLQAASIKNAGDAKYRSDASQLASSLIAQMWTTDHSQATLQTNFSSTGNGYKQWLNSVNATLPGVSGVAGNQPQVVITAVSAPSTLDSTMSSKVDITLYWATPAEAAQGIQHNYQTTTQIAEVN